MEGAPLGVRLRQAVLVARELEPAIAQLRSSLSLQEPFRDPGVGQFGLANAVFALGDCFLEVVSPQREGTTAGRYLERDGDGGYMVMFDVLDLAGARERAAERGVRIVWQIDLPDISGTHLHPRDIGGAIVSVDRSNPYGSWRWGGPEWTGAIGSGAPGALRAVTMSVRDPQATASLWAHVLGVPVEHGAGTSQIPLDGGRVLFEPLQGERPERLTEIALELPAELPGEAELANLLGVRVRRLDAAPRA